MPTCARRADHPPPDPGPVDQVRAVFGIQKRTVWVNAIAFILAAPMGGAVPCFVSHLAHHEVGENPWLWLPILGGCWFSATTVARWGTRAFGDPAKAWGFTILLEASMIMSRSPAVGWAALSMLAAINALATACTLILDNRRGPGRGTSVARHDA